MVNSQGITLANLVSPKDARRLLDACFPLASVDLKLHWQPSSAQTVSNDGVIHVGLRDGALREFALFPPIVLGPNTTDDSNAVATSPGSASRARGDSLKPL
jgi:hypothetical protein